MTDTGGSGSIDAWDHDRPSSQARHSRAAAGSPRAASPAGRQWLAAEVDALDASLHVGATPERAAQEKRYLKSDLTFYGLAVPRIRAVARDHARRHPDLDHDRLVALVDALWSRPVHERRALAVELLDQHHHLLGAGDLALIERLLREARTWALVDNLAASVAGPLLDRVAGADDTLDRWAADPDFWVRRSALLAHLVALRRGTGDFERFARYADAMLDEREFFIRKAIGWVLRDTARLRPDLVFAWLLPRAHRASGVTIREAVKKLSPEQTDAVRSARAQGSTPPHRRQ